MSATGVAAEGTAATAETVANVTTTLSSVAGAGAAWNTCVSEGGTPNCFAAITLSVGGAVTTLGSLFAKSGHPLIYWLNQLLGVGYSADLRNYDGNEGS